VAEELAEVREAVAVVAEESDTAKSRRSSGGRRSRVRRRRISLASLDVDAEAACAPPT